MDRYYIPTWENVKNENLSFVTNDDTLVGKDNLDAFKRKIVKVVDSDVYDSVENSLALSKANFANYILNEQVSMCWNTLHRLRLLFCDFC